MFHNRIPIFLAWLIIFIVGCDDKGTDPPQVIPGSRDYSWNLYEENEPIYFKQMIAFDSRDIWAVSTGDKTRFFWHWDGSNWHHVDCGINIFSAWSLWGKSSDVLYIGDGDGEIYKYDGKSAKKITKLSIDGFDVVSILQMADDKKGNVYLVGAALRDNFYTQHGVIYKFEDDEFKLVELTTEADLMFNRIVYDKYEGIFVLFANDLAGQLSAYSFDGQNLQKILDNGSVGLLNIDQGVHIVSKSIVYKAKKDGVVEELDLSMYFGPGFGVGRNFYDFFTNTYNGGDGSGAGLSHYNGHNLELVYPIQGNFSRMFIFEEDLICVGRYFSNTNTFTLHGQLN